MVHACMPLWIMSILSILHWPLHSWSYFWRTNLHKWTSWLGSALSGCFVMMLTEAILITYYTSLTMELDTTYFCLNLKNKVSKTKPSKIRSSISWGKIMEDRQQELLILIENWASFQFNISVEPTLFLHIWERCWKKQFNCFKILLLF